MKIAPVVCKWQMVDVSDEGTGVVDSVLAMVPALRYRKVAEKQFHVGDEYPLIVMQPRSRASHSQYFAAIGDGFENLPDKIAARFPTAEHLRKWLLIETGWCTEKEFEFEGRDAEKQARRLALFIRTEDEHARISLSKVDVTPVKFKVIVRRAMSQEHAAMDKETFQQSKKAVLDLLEQLISVPKGALMKNAGRSA